MTKIDEFSRVLGGLEQSTEGLRHSFDQHCTDDDRRHVENLAAMHEMTGQIRKLTETLQPVAEWARGAKPELEALKTSRTKLAGVASVLLILAGGAIWLLEKLIDKALSWAIGGH